MAYILLYCADDEHFTWLKALSQNPNNMYAANGIGMVLAEKGQFDMAKEIFTQVLDIHM